MNSNDPYLLMTLISRTRRELCFKGLQVGGSQGGGGLEAPGGSSASRASRCVWGGRGGSLQVYVCVWGGGGTK